MLNRIFKSEFICKVTRIVMVVMWLLAFFSIGKYDLGVISFKQAIQSIILYAVYFIINAFIYGCNEC